MEKQQHLCGDCGAPVSRSGVRCRSCGAAERWKTRARKRPFVEFGGVRYYRQGDGYWRASRHAGNELLHRAVWRAAYGDIPAGQHVHHIDGDSGNNSLENLQVIKPQDHAKHHYRPDRLLSDEAMFKLGKSQRERWKKIEPREHTCDQCGGQFQSRGNWVRFCSPKCNAAWWNWQRRSRAKAAGLQPPR
ncbi:MAG: HNH endonuclease [Myxococcales bacterium]|nr:HNH endonuclease [Myxococcales bacterium]